MATTRPLASRPGRRPGAPGFSLVEVVSAMVISAMILAATMVVYCRMQQSALAVLARVNQSNLPSEVLQLIAEDLDDVTAGPGVQVLIDNKLDKGFPVARLTIRKTVTNKKNEDQLFEEIIWQGAYDAATDRVTLYRSHDGLVEEDRFLDHQRSDSERLFPFVPVCSGLTEFQVEAPQGENMLDRWANPTPPTGVQVTLSFADPVRSPQGELEIPQESLITRMIAVDRSRQVKFEVAVADANGSGPDANAASAEAQKTAATDGNQPSRTGTASVKAGGNRPVKVRQESVK